MLTIEKVFGHSNPSISEVDSEFESRKLTLNGFDMPIVEKQGKHHIHGHYSTQSENEDTASKKMLIIFNELGC